MADMKDKIKDTMNDAENRAHEIKGRIEQKRRDNMNKDKSGAN